MYAKLIIVGYLGQDPEMRYTPDGTPVANFSVAVNRKWNNSDGSQGEETIWFRCTAWRKTAEVCNQYLTKGRQVLIEGRLRPDDNGGPRVFTRSDGSAGASFEVTIETVKFLGGGNQASDATASAASAPAPMGEDEIPF
jgi:single-strand DNA-binding protein